MAVTFKFIGSLRSMSGKNEFTLSLEDNVPLNEAVKRVSDELPKLGRVLMNSDGEIATSNALLLVNGKDISVLEGLETLLKDGDEVTIVPVLHGG